jgi:hypothetical protein
MVAEVIFMLLGFILGQIRTLQRLSWLALGNLAECHSYHHDVSFAVHLEGAADSIS